MEEIRLGLKKGIDISIYVDDFDWMQIDEIRQGLQ